jgi:hypothetical protein
VAWQNMNTLPSFQVCKEKYIYLLYLGFATDNHVQALLGQSLHVGYSHLFLRYIGLYEARDFVNYFSQNITWFRYPMDLFLKLWHGKRCIPHLLSV